MDKCRYADKLIEKYKIFYGRIGTLCDECKLEDCPRNPKKLSPQGIENGYALWGKGYRDGKD